MGAVSGNARGHTTAEEDFDDIVSTESLTAISSSSACSYKCILTRVESWVWGTSDHHTAEHCALGANQKHPMVRRRHTNGVQVTCPAPLGACLAPLLARC
jgi:hypothetical protein